MNNQELIRAVGKALLMVADELADDEWTGIEVQRRGVEGEQWVVFARDEDTEIRYLFDHQSPELAIAVAEAVAAVLELPAERI